MHVALQRISIRDTIVDTGDLSRQCPANFRVYPNILGSTLNIQVKFSRPINLLELLISYEPTTGAIQVSLDTYKAGGSKLKVLT